MDYAPLVILTTNGSVLPVPGMSLFRKVAHHSLFQKVMTTYDYFVKPVLATISVSEGGI